MLISMLFCCLATSVPRARRTLVRVGRDGEDRLGEGMGDCLRGGMHLSSFRS